MVIPARDGIQDAKNRGSEGERILSSGEEEYDDRPTFLRTP